MRGFFLTILTLLALSAGAKTSGGGEKTPPSAPYKHERFFTTFGYGFNFPAYKTLNYVLGRFNQQAGVTQTLGPIQFMHGFTISAGSTNDNYMLEFSYTQSKARTSGQYVGQGITTTRNVSVRNNKGAAGLSAKFTQAGRFKFYMGGSVTFGYQNIYTHAYRNIDEKHPPLAKVGIGDLQLGLSVAPQVHFVLDKAARLRIVARPYFNMEFLEAYYGDLNKTINPGFYPEGSNNNLYNRPWAAGVEFKFYVAL